VLKDTAGNVLAEKLVNNNSITILDLQPGHAVSAQVSARNKTVKAGSRRR